MEWKPITPTEPAEGETVLTQIDDGDGVRNVQHLTRGPGKLWFIAGESVYVYYTPTHFVSNPIANGGQ